MKRQAVVWIIAVIFTAGLSACAGDTEVAIRPEKHEVAAGERILLSADLRNETEGTYIERTFWTITVADCGELSNTTGNTVWWTAPHRVLEARQCDIAVEMVLKDRRFPNFEETATSVFEIVVMPSQTSNAPPAVTLIVPPMACAAANQTVSLRVEASDPEGGLLSYQWTASGGSFQGSTVGAGAVWIAPQQQGAYTVRVSVTDRENASAGASAVFTRCG